MPSVAACLYGALSALKPSAVSSPALSKNDHDPSVDTLVERNAELEREIEERILAETHLRRVQADLSTSQRLAQVGSWPRKGPPSPAGA